MTALGNCWCPDHFTCANPQCGVKLIDIGFVEDGGHLYCEKDYEKYLAPHCKKCNGAIVGVSAPSTPSCMQPLIQSAARAAARTVLLNHSYLIMTCATLGGIFQYFHCQKKNEHDPTARDVDPHEPPLVVRSHEDL